MRGQLAWRCRRGMKELDLLLNRYLGERWLVAPAAERRAFADLLELPDPQIAAYLLGGEATADPALGAVLLSLRARRDG